MESINFEWYQVKNFLYFNFTNKKPNKKKLNVQSLKLKFGVDFNIQDYKYRSQNRHALDLMRVVSKPLTNGKFTHK